MRVLAPASATGGGLHADADSDATADAVHVSLPASALGDYGSHVADEQHALIAGNKALHGDTINFKENGSEVENTAITSISIKDGHYAQRNVDLADLHLSEFNPYPPDTDWNRFVVM